MGRLGRFLALPVREKWLLLKAWGLVFLVRIALWTMPFKQLTAILERFSRRQPRHLLANPEPARHIAWAVMIASRFVPGARHCLTRALVAKVLLDRRGYAAEMRIGVAPDGPDKIIAHAWLEADGEVIIGGGDLGKYTLLTSGDRVDPHLFPGLTARPPLDADHPDSQ